MTRRRDEIEDETSQDADAWRGWREFMRGAGVSDRMSSSETALAWLVRLRWHALGGQLVTIAIAVLVFGMKLPLAFLFTALAMLAASNAAVAIRLRRRSRGAPLAGASRLLGAALLFDTALLLAELAFTGGMKNPFALLLLVEVQIAVLALNARWVAAVVVSCIVGCTLMQRFHEPLIGLTPEAERWGSWAAVVFAVAAVGLLGSRLAAAIRAQSLAVERAQRLGDRAEKLASLTTLAAGAAHELGTPLGTIAIASNELETLIETAPGEALEEARVIRDEVDRCRAILERMSGRAGTLAGELPQRIDAASVFSLVRGQLGPTEQERLRVAGDVDVIVHCPVKGLVQAIAGLVANAMQASGEHSEVVVEVVRERDVARFVVCDRGTGIPAQLLPRLGEPFFTTKPPGKGMGLGLFLAQSFTELCAGNMEISSTENEGTRVCLTLPRVMDKAR